MLKAREVKIIYDGSAYESEDNQYDFQTSWETNHS